MEKKRRSKICILTSALFLCLSLSVLLPGKASAEEDTVRVSLSVDPSSKLSMSVKGGYTILESGTEVENGTLTLTAEGRTVSVSHNRLGDIYTGRSVTLARKDPRPDAGHMTFKVNGYTRSYLGDFTVTASGGNLSVINEVPLTHYLYGVVGYEMSNTWPVEALKAQTVAAKNYVLAKKGAGGNYDVKDTAADQVYKGYFSSLKNVISAVDESAGFGLYLQGTLIPCYYSASNGGYTILPSANWGETVFDAAYTEGTDPFDIRNTASRTEALYIPQDLARRSFSSAALYRYVTERLKLAASEPGAVSEGRAFDSLLEISSIVSTNAEGVATPDGNHEQIIMNVKVLTRPDAVLQPRPTPSPVPDGAQRADGMPESPDAAREEMISVTISFSEMAQAGLFQDKSLRIYHVLPADGGWTLFHGRYGHGVGMSQRGAQQMAREGWTFDRILQFYYPGADLLEDGSPEAGNGQTQTAPPATPSPEPGRTLDEKNNATVEKTTVLYSGAGTDTPEVETLQKGDRVQATAISGEWYLIRDNRNNKVGYAYYANLTVTGEKGLAAGIITGSSVNVRSGPGTEYDSIGRLDKNERVEILSIGEGWHRVRSSTGAVGYVSAEYVGITGSLANASEPDRDDSEGSGQVVIRIAPTPPPERQNIGESLSAGTVVSSDAPFRTGPSETASVLGRYERGTEFRIYAKTGSWYYAELASTGQKGYVSVKRIALNSEEENIPAQGAAARITEPDTPLRSGSGNRFNCLARLERNTYVTVIGSSGSWYQVVTSDTGKTGFVFGPYLDFETQDAEQGNTGIRSQGTVLANVLEVRDAPDAGKGKVVQRILRGYTVTVRSISDGWARISFNGTEGYCLARYLELK